MKKIVFFSDVKSEDYREFSQSQTSIIDITKIKPGTDIALLYDFKAVWIRVFFTKIANMLNRAGMKNNPFVDFCLATQKGTNSILDGLLKGLKVEVKLPLGPIVASLNLDEKSFSKDTLTLTEFNEFAERLFVKHCKDKQFYFFIDELVVSTLNTYGDEYKLRVALIRDLISVVAKMNDLFAREDMDAHFIITLRPEIRHRVNMLDTEIGKIVDGNDVVLHWDHLMENNEHILVKLMKIKIEKGVNELSYQNVSGLFDSTIEFGKRSENTMQFLLNNSWYRPRDFVRYLKCFAKMSPHQVRINTDVIKKGLNEYARNFGKRNNG